MSRLAKLQIIGPAVLSAAIVAGELAAHALALKPSSEIIWYLNLQLFGVFQRSHYILSDHFAIPYFQLLFVAAPILLFTWIGLAFHRSLPIAVASSLSLVYSCFLAYAWQMVETPSLQAASLAGSLNSSAMNFSAFSFSAGSHAYVLTILLFLSLVSCIASHFSFIRTLRATC